MMNKSIKFLLNICIFLTALVFILAMVEIVFRILPPQSDAFDITLSAKRWYEKYWQINSNGFRDIEHDPHASKNKKLLFVVGDSFAAGQGIRNPSNRFSNLLGELVGVEWEVFNMAQNGWSTTDELDFLFNYQYKPDIVVLSYYVNDILGTQRSLNNHPPIPLEMFETDNDVTISHKIRRKSYLVDFIYWRLYRLNRDVRSYWEWLKGGYDNKTTWLMHRVELSSIANYLEMNDADLLVVIFPNLMDIRGSRKITSKVSNYFESIGVTTIDLTDTLINIPTSDLIVSRTNPHPNERTHKVVAELIYESLNQTIHQTPLQ
jgi:hypothetical protein